MATEAKQPLSVPDRGIASPTIGFSMWLEYLLCGGLSALFLIGVLVDGYLDYVFTAQVHATLLLLLAAIAGTLLMFKRESEDPGYLYQGILGLVAVGSVCAAAVFFIYPSLTQIGAPHWFVRVLTYMALFTLGYWAWGCWLWIFAQVWLQRSVPSPLDGKTDREKETGHTLLQRIKERYAEVSEYSGKWKLVHLWKVTGELLKHVFFGRLGTALLDPVMLYPKREERSRIEYFFRAAGHRIIEPDNPVHSSEYDEHRLAAYKSFITAVILIMLVAGLFDIDLPLRETPKGVLGGTGKRIARGKVAVNRKKSKKKKRKKRKKKKREREKVKRKSLLKMYEQEMEKTEEVLKTSDATVTANVGLPSGHGSGPTAAGSPKGTKVGGKYYMFRVKHEGNWDANRRGIPALMREFTNVWNVKTNRMDQPVELSKLRRHSGKYFPVLLYITGNGEIGAGQQGIKNLRWYLKNGGFLFADSSGGNFYHNFRRLMRRVLPNKSLRRISYDHTIFRGAYMPWHLSNGAPVFRDHPGPNDAQGIYVKGRLAVFYSGGDLGAAWAAVGWGRSRGQVELAFRMGINILTYAFLYGGEKGMEADEE